MGQYLTITMVKLQDDTGVETVISFLVKIRLKVAQPELKSKLATRTPVTLIAHALFPG